MTLEQIAITTVFLGIPIAIAVVSRGKYAQELSNKARKYIEEDKEIKRKIEKKIREKEAAEVFNNTLRNAALAESMKPSFNYSETELNFRRDIDLIQRGLHFSGSYAPEESDFSAYNEIYQGSGIMDGVQGYVHYFPWLKVYYAFFDNESFVDDKLSVVSDGTKTQMLLDGKVIVTKEVVGDIDGVLDIVTLSDCSHKDFETMFYLNRIIAAYGHNIIVDDAKVNPRYGRVDIDKKTQLAYLEKYIPWRIKNAFSKSDDIEMIDWSGGARIEVEIWKDHLLREMLQRDVEHYLCAKTTFYMDGIDNPIGTMGSYAYFSVEEFNYHYPSTI